MSCPAHADVNWCNRMQWNRMLCLLLYVSTYVCMYVCAVSLHMFLYVSTYVSEIHCAEHVNEFHDFVPAWCTSAGGHGGFLNRGPQTQGQLCQGLKGLYGCLHPFKRTGIKYPHQTPPVCTQVVDNKIQHTIVHLILKSPLEVWTVLSTFA